MAHGTPSTPEGIEPFYTAIRRGHPPSPELLAELAGRYRAIGGTSPLTERTAAQVAALGAALEADAPGTFAVHLGAKFTEPSIEAGVAHLAAEGPDRVVGIVLTPHESAPGSGEYLRRAAAAAAATIPTAEFVPVRSWHRAAGLAPILAERTAAALSAVPPARRRRTAVFFTAHSLPRRALADGDPYPTQVGESAGDIAALLDLEATPELTWSVAWQSAGRTPDPWLEPALIDEIRRVAAEGATAVVVCPVGFVADHLEVLYDLDIEAAGVASEAGLAFARTRSLNDDPRFIAILAEVVRAASAGEPADRPRDPARPTATDSASRRRPA
jgi:ferrochelatase